MARRPYFSPSSNVTLGLMGHGRQNWKQYSLELEANPQLQITDKKVGFACTHSLISIYISLSGCEQESGRSPSMPVTMHTSSGGSRAMWSFSFKVLLCCSPLWQPQWLRYRMASNKEARADRELLERLWQHYKKRYVDDAGFVWIASSSGLPRKGSPMLCCGPHGCVTGRLLTASWRGQKPI